MGFMSELSLSKKAKAIIEGWRNYATDSGINHDVVVSRAKTCSDCPHSVKGKLITMVKDELKEIEGHKCELCGCPLSAKIRQSVELCELGKW